MNIKTIIELDTDTVSGIFERLGDFVNCLEDEPVAIVTEDETFVIMTADDFQYLQKAVTSQSSLIVSYDMLNELETLGITELETLLSLVSSQLNLKMAKQYFKK